MSGDEMDRDFNDIVTPHLWSEIERRAAEPDRDVPGLRDFMERNVKGGELDGLKYAASSNMSDEAARELAEDAISALTNASGLQIGSRCSECGSSCEASVSSVDAMITYEWKCACGHWWTAS